MPLKDGATPLSFRGNLKIIRRRGAIRGEIFRRSFR
jgi:hypothetical protein